VTAVASDGVITDIESKTVADIDIDVKPRLAYSAAVQRAEVATNENFEPQDEGRLVVYRTAGGYALSWLGLVASGTALQNVIFDANSGAILARYPATSAEEKSNDE
jgi:hypothetical protein